MDGGVEVCLRTSVEAELLLGALLPANVGSTDMEGAIVKGAGRISRRSLAGLGEGLGGSRGEAPGPAGDVGQSDMRGLAPQVTVPSPVSACLGAGVAPKGAAHSRTARAGRLRVDPAPSHASAGGLSGCGYGAVAAAHMKHASSRAQATLTTFGGLR